MSDARPERARRLILLGSTGSIGTSTLEVLAALGERAPQLVALAAGRRGDRLGEQVARTGVRDAALEDDGAADAERSAAAAAPAGVRLRTGPGAAAALVAEIARPGDLVVNAIVGAAGLRATLAAVERGCDVALANKESLVAGGALVTRLARANRARIVPVDSEHAAIAQCLGGPAAAGRAVRRIVLTASGGPFRTWTAERAASATVAEALRHPTWTMGRKITIDSASMMNKALEVVEAHWLFGLEPGRIAVLIHPQSIVHGLVELADGSLVAQLARPDMRVPIQQAILGGAEAPAPAPLDLSALARLEFEPADESRWPALAVARRTLERGGTAGAVMNAANEAAVHAFLQERIPFGAIVDLVADAVESIAPGGADALADILAADAEARAFVESRIAAAASRARTRPLAHPATGS